MNQTGPGNTTLATPRAPYQQSPAGFGVRGTPHAFFDTGGRVAAIDLSFISVGVHRRRNESRT